MDKRIFDAILDAQEAAVMDYYGLLIELHLRTLAFMAGQNIKGSV